MKTDVIKRAKGLKKAYVKARCHESLKAEVDWVAGVQGIDHADVVRIACENHVQKVRDSVRAIAS